jgi:solute carrier family 25 (mitochondrial oxoglutarate transporter), member 11
MAMMISYDKTKEKIVEKTGRKPTELYVSFLASMVSAVCTAFFSLPADNIKTKMQKQKPNAEGILPYKGMPDCIAKTLAKEGVTGFWAGLPTYYFRVGPHSAIVLLLSEVYRNLLGVGKQ